MQGLGITRLQGKLKVIVDIMIKIILHILAQKSFYFATLKFNFWATNSSLFEFDRFELGLIDR